MMAKLFFKRYWTGLTTLACLLFWAFSAAPAAAQSADLYLSPASGSLRVGDSFSVTVMVNSADREVSAVSGTVSFNVDDLDLVSIIKSGSVIDMWTVEPAAASKNGSVKFEGVVYAPGFRGSGGTVLILRFRARSVSVTDLNFTAAAVMANDAVGTNIIGRASGASFAIGAALPPAQALALRLPARATALPPPCQVGSMTHPDGMMWVSDNNPQFTWSLTPDIVGVSYLIDDRPETVPDAESEGLLDSYSAGGLDDGTQYFHCRLQNGLGWGPAAHYQFRIDKMPPKAFDVKYLDATQAGLGESWLAFRTTDDLSGVGHYEVYIDDTWMADIPAGPAYDWKIFSPSSLDPGEHDVVTSAFDLAGNSIAASRHFVVVLPMTLWEAILALGGWKLALLLAALLLTVLVIIRLLSTFYLCPSRQEIRRLSEDLRRQCDKLVELTDSEWKDIKGAHHQHRRLFWGEGDRCFWLKTTITAADRAVRRAIRRLGGK